MYTAEVSKEIVFLLTFITGVLYFGYITAVIFEITGSTHASESKYAEIINQLKHMRTTNLPLDVRKKMIMH